MSHDIDDLLDLIKKLEARVIVLEKKGNTSQVVSDDAWYWEHG